MGNGSWGMGVGKHVKRFEDLKTWQESQNMAVMIYKLSANFPPEEKFGLTDQIRRASSSVSANIAEGYGRKSSKDSLHFYVIAYGSLLEVKSFLYLANRLDLLSSQELSRCIEKVESCQKLLNGFMLYARKQS